MFNEDYVLGELDTIKLSYFGEWPHTSITFINIVNSFDGCSNSIKQR